MVLMTFLFSGLTLGETIDDLVKRDGLYYKEFTDVPFTGKITGKKQGSYIVGKRVGFWVSYHDNGQLSWKVTFKDGKEEGIWTHYSRDGSVLGQGED